MKLKIGMKVKCIRNIADYKIKGLIGRIIIVDKVFYRDYSYGIEFNEFIDGGDCWGRGEYGYCLWLNGKDIIPFNLKQRIK